MTEEQVKLLQLAETTDKLLYAMEEAMRTRINPERDPVVEQICNGIDDVRAMRRKIHKWKLLIEDWTPVE